MRSDLIVRIIALAEAAEAGGEADIAEILRLVVLTIGERTDAVLLAELRVLLATVPALRRFQPSPLTRSA